MKTKNNQEHENKIYFAMIVETLGGPELTCKDENENPWLFLSEKDCWKEIVDSKMIELNEFMLDRREFDISIFENDLYPIEVRVEGNWIVGNSDGEILRHQITKGTKINFEPTPPA